MHTCRERAGSGTCLNLKTFLPGGASAAPSLSSAGMALMSATCSAATRTVALYVLFTEGVS